MIDQPTDPDIETFLAHLRERLYAGKREYGDASHRRPEAEIRDERLQEALDAAGWSYVLWRQLRVTPETPEKQVGARADQNGELTDG